MTVYEYNYDTFEWDLVSTTSINLYGTISIFYFK